MILWRKISQGGKDVGCNITSSDFDRLCGRAYVPPSQTSASVVSVNRCQFHQHFMSSFYAPDTKSAKKDTQVQQLFALLGSAHVKALRKHVDGIDPRAEKFNLKLSSKEFN